MDAHYGMGEYNSAAVEGQNLIRVYPTSELADDTQLKVAMSYYNLSPDFRLDQKYTLQAISEFEALMEDYPLSNHIEEAKQKIIELIDKLAKKRFKNAELYKKRGNYFAAQKYFKTLIKDFSNSSWTPIALYFMGECEINLKENEKAKEIFVEFLNIFPDHKYAENAKFWIEQIDRGDVQLKN